MGRPLGRWIVPSQRGRKLGSSGRKNGGMGSKGKDKKLSGTDSEQEVSEALSPLSCPSELARGLVPSSPCDLVVPRFLCKLELGGATSCCCHTRGLGSSVMGTCLSCHL